MIKNIEVKGFKSFKDLTLSFRPLTVLCGVNGSGKSSVMQLLLLLKAFAVDAKAGLVRLNNADYLNLGRRKDVVYRWSVDRVIRIGLATDAGTCTVLSSAEGDVSEDDFIGFKSEKGDTIREFPTDLFDKRVRYLSANRQPPKSQHARSTYAERTRDVGAHGETAVSLLYRYGLEPISQELCHEPISKEPSPEEAEGKCALNYQVNAWLRDVSPGVSVRATPEGNVLRLDIDYGSTTPAKDFRPENVGFGISYVLPVLVMILTAQKGDCLLIENPGAHLHPQGQAQLGRLIAKAAAYGIQIIIETHSDHIINGIRLAYKKINAPEIDEIERTHGRLEDDIFDQNSVIYYFNRKTADNDGQWGFEEQWTEATKIRIAKNGALERYPDGFLDQWSTSMEKLWS